MEMEQRQETSEVQGRMLEVPEVVPGTASVDFPEIADFLRSMKMKSGLFGFQKEDVYEKMQQLNKMYQIRAQQMREQNRELVMIGEELERLNERFLLLKNKVKALTEEEQTENEE